MTLITIQEQSRAGERFTVSVSFDRQGGYAATVAPPFDPEREQQLEWYFEEHLQFPFTDHVKARDAAASITDYGETLFEQVFADPETRAEYIQARQQGVNQIQFEIVGTPELHRLHWEALKDPKQPRAFALDGVMIRKHAHPQPVKARVQSGPTINLLIVVARPSGAHDVGYRTISRPLVEELRQAGIPVQIDIVRPGSYEALDKHLQQTTAAHGVGYYHVIHFDVHGALLRYDQVQQGIAANRFVYGSRYGRNDIQLYEGFKAFLFTEGDEQPSDPVEAAELAQLLTTHHIPIAVLNACQSGKQVGAAETSLGSQLMQAGVQLVVAMGYSVTVSAAEIMMRELYQQLFNRADLATALRLARRALFNRKSRRAYFNQTIELEDWLLPVVYQNQPIQLTPRPMTTEEAQQFYGQQAQRFPFPEPSYGFWGGDLDVL
jgi:hypothetical protein